MKISARKLKNDIVQILGDAGVSPASFNADLLFDHFAGITKLMLLTETDLTVSESIAEKITAAAKACAEGKPLQHIIGYTEFMGIRFKVNKNVLIPRPDTEILVTEAVKRAKGMTAPVKILDLCTGSGCIAVALSHFIEGADIHASDISESALEVARENALLNQFSHKITFHSGSYFAPFADTEKFDIIVSNPPYIPTDDIEELSPEVKLHEPMNALDGGKDGLTAYREIISSAPKHLNRDGMILFEVGIGQAADASKLLEKDFTDIGSVYDYGGIERVVYGKLI